ncbi:MAG: phosphoglycerate kinase [Candidatus Micrarchaeia archaeon]
MEFFTLDDFEFEGKTTLVRVDINSSMDPGSGRILASERIESHSETVRELSEKGARVVVMSHQGRVGDPDFLPLKPHAELLASYVKKDVEYVDDIFGSNALGKIKAMRNGDILLLENVRFLAEETIEKPGEAHAKSVFVKTLAPHADYFVLDAFSAAHRPHCSIIGFAYVLPTCAGRVMEREIKSLSKAVENPKKPLTLIAGGVKAEDTMQIIEYWLGRGILDRVLTGGAIGNIFLAAEGRDLGVPTTKFLVQKGLDKYIPKAKELLAKYDGKIQVPVDFAFEKNGERVEQDVIQLPSAAPIKDIGSETARRYSDFIRQSNTIIMNGPMGVYEDANFSKGTELVLRAIANSGAFSLLGGGNTVDAVGKLKLDAKNFSYMSLAGKAFIEFLMGMQLPGIKALEDAYKRGR